MVTKRNYAISWRNMFMEWVSKSRDSNWKSTSAHMNLILGTDNKWKSDERSSLSLGAKKARKIDMKVLQKKEFDGQ